MTEEFGDTKGVIRIRKSKDRQYNGQGEKEERTNNDLQNIQDNQPQDHFVLICKYIDFKYFYKYCYSDSRKL